MKVLVLTSTYPRWQGDTEPGFVHELNKRLAKEHQIFSLAPSYPGAKCKEIIDDVIVIRYRYFFSSMETLCYRGGILPNIKKYKWKFLLVPFLLIGMAIAVIRIHKKIDPDLVHNHWILPQGIIWAILSKLIFKQTPAIVTSHGGDLFSLKGYFLEKLKKYSLRQHFKICVVSKAMQTEAKNLGIDPEQIKVIPMGVDLTNTFVPPPESKERQGIIFIGRLVSKKGVNYLLEAYKTILESHPNIALKIVGEGPEEPTLIALSKRLNIADKVKFLGAKDQTSVREHLQNSKYAIFPSIITNSGDKEGLGLTIIEALGCDCITITTQQDAFNDIKAVYKNLICVKEKSSQDIANQIIKLERDNIDHINLEHKSQLIKAFDWNEIAIKYSKIYRMARKA